jgi:hypothetical protein
LTKIINELVKTNEELSEADIESLQILTEDHSKNSTSVLFSKPQTYPQFVLKHISQ